MHLSIPNSINSIKVANIEKPDQLTGFYVTATFAINEFI